jgi:Flp pilus assembly protein TadG
MMLARGMMRHAHRRSLRQHTHGQALILFAIALPVLISMVLVAIEVGERYTEIQMVEDALQQATRSAVQQLDYRPFADGKTSIRITEACHDVAWDDAACRPVTEVARQLFLVNLTDARGLVEGREALADQVRWTVLPHGGTCRSSATSAPVTEPSPMLCAEVRPVLRGIVGWGTYRPLIAAADTLDDVR